ncbi:tryptophan--tRNA ligase [Sphaerisporangium perillae]|uniref:tryptophan--tRNA ligase n=1 Tax=Sphaerisporangium perillae TaxID=2935860 RepID=UPI00200E5AB8
MRHPTPAATLADGDPPGTLTARAAHARSATLEKQIRQDPGRFRVLTGDRPTGRLHLGHYFGTLHNRVRLQDLGVRTFLIIADYQVLTDRDVADDLSGHVEELVLDYLAAGIDPTRTTIFTHSAVPALNQLLLPFLSLVSVAELSRNPTVKDEITHSRRSSVSGLMFTYPAHQAADILFCKANLVPVGQDQLPHLELTRTIARRFNDRYGGGTTVFHQPDALLSAAPLLLGTDGTKMSKSRGNAITLAAGADETAWLIRGAKTDSQRHITYDPATRPEVVLPHPAGRPLPGPRPPAGRRRHRLRRVGRAEETPHRGGQRAPGAHPGPPRPVRARPRPPAPGAARGQRTRQRRRRGHPR